MGRKDPNSIEVYSEGLDRAGRLSIFRAGFQQVFDQQKCEHTFVAMPTIVTLDYASLDGDREEDGDPNLGHAFQMNRDTLVALIANLTNALADANHVEFLQHQENSASGWQRVEEMQKELEAAREQNHKLLTENRRLAKEKANASVGARKASKAEKAAKARANNSSK